MQKAHSQADSLIPRSKHDQKSSTSLGKQPQIDEWSQYKSVISQKYIDENLSTKQVQQYMISTHLFHKSIQQFERRFKSWGLRKNHTQSKYILAAQLLKRKRLSPDGSEAIIDNVFVPNKKLRKEISRHVPLSLSSRSETIKDNHADASRTEISVIVRPALRNDVKLCIAQDLFWFDFIDSVFSGNSSSTTMADASLDVTGAFNILDGVQRTALHQLVLSHRSPPIEHNRSMTYGSVQAVLELEPFIPDRQVNNFLESITKLSSDCEMTSKMILMSYQLFLMSNQIQGANHHAFLRFIMRHTSDKALATIIRSSSATARTIAVELLQYAVQTRDHGWLKRLVVCGMNVDCVLPADNMSLSSSPMTPLSAAYRPLRPWLTYPSVIKDVIIFTQALLEAGADPNKCGCHFWEADAGCQRKSFLSQGYNDKQCCDRTPLRMAVEGSNRVYKLSFERQVLVRMFLRFGARPCRCLNITRAIEGGLWMDTLQELLQEGARADGGWNIGGRYLSPLQAALGERNRGLVNLLLAHGASPIDIDILEPHFQEWLLHYQVAARDTLLSVLDFRLPFTLALIFDQGIARQLLALGARVNGCYLDWLSPPEVADWHEQTLTLDSSLELQAAMLSRSYVALTPVAIAVSSADVDMVRLALESGCTTETCHGDSPLFTAVRLGWSMMVQLLLASGVRIENTASQYGQGLGEATSRRRPILSPLAEASARGDVEIMNMLLHACADINFCHKERGVTPLQAALICRADSSVNRLLSDRRIDVWHPGSSVWPINAFSATILGERMDMFTSLTTYPCDDGDRRSSILQNSLLFAIQNCSLSFVSRLLGLGTNIYDSGFIQSVIKSHDEELLENLVDAATTLNEVLDVDMLLSLMLTQALKLEETKFIWQNWIFFVDVFNSNADSFKTYLRLEADKMLRNLKFSPESPKELLPLSEYCRWLATSIGQLWKKEQGNEILAMSLLFAFHEPRSLLYGNLSQMLRSCKIEKQVSQFMPILPLQAAIRLGDICTVQDLINRGADVNGISSCRGCLNQACHESVQDCTYFISCDNLLSNNFDVSWLIETALGAACRQGSLEMVELLVSAGADVNLQASPQALPALTIAAALGHIDIVAKLVTAGADVDANVSDVQFPRTALQAACEFGHLDIVKILINNDANINAPAGHSGVTALQAAAIKGYFKIAQILIGAGAKVSAPGGVIAGRTAIDGAAEQGRLDLVKFLLDHYDGDEAISSVCESAIKYARSRGYMVIADVLATYQRPDKR